MSMIINLSTTHVSCKSVKKFFFFVLHSITIFFFVFFFPFLYFFILFVLVYLVWFGFGFLPSLDIKVLNPRFSPHHSLPYIIFPVYLCIYVCSCPCVSLCVRYFFFSHFSLFKWFSTTISSW